MTGVIIDPKFAASSAPVTPLPALLDDSARSMQAIAAEVGDYSRRLIEDSTSTMGQLAQAKSLPDAIGALSAFNKRTGEEYMLHMNRVAGMFAEAARQQTLMVQAMMKSGGFMQMPLMSSSMSAFGQH